MHFVSAHECVRRDPFRIADPPASSSSGKFKRQPILPLDGAWQVEGRDPAVPDDGPAVDDRVVRADRTTEGERGDRVVERAGISDPVEHDGEAVATMK
jgi:hypothetical protein